MRVLVTGGVGFIGSALIRYLLTETDCQVVNVDCLTYAASPEALAEVAGSDRYVFEHVDICDGPALQAVFLRHDPDAVLHLAAETHVDRSIDAPATFIRTNVAGTCLLLEAATQHWSRLPGGRKERFRFHHVSTDEVFGSLGDEGFFTEETRYAPNSPYSASKASSDHFVRAWHATYGLPVVLSNCSNNYGSYQYPEKLIPLMTLNALTGRRLPVYGTGSNVRDWLFVDDHARALWLILTRGRVGESYNVGGCNEVRNIDVVHQICDLVDEMAAPLASGPRRGLISYVTDRPGHDFRYAIDAGKIRDEFGWTPRESFASGLRQTVAWYLANGAWCDTVRARTGYDGGRLGLGSKESN